MSGEFGPCVVCAAEGKRLIAFLTNPRTVLMYCSGDYTRCPSWRAEKDSDPAAAIAQGIEPEVTCPECEGDGAAFVVGEKPDGTLQVLCETPCDVCRGSGRVSSSVSADELAAVNRMMGQG